MKTSLFAILFCLSVFISFAQSDASLTITNEENKTTTLSATDMAAMPHVSVEIKAHDGNTHSYSGIVLMNLLQRAGVHMGDSAKKNVASTLR